SSPPVTLIDSELVLFRYVNPTAPENVTETAFGSPNCAVPVGPNGTTTWFAVLSPTVSTASASVNEPLTGNPITPLWCTSAATCGSSLATEVAGNWRSCEVSTAAKSKSAVCVPRLVNMAASRTTGSRRPSGGSAMVAVPSSTFQPAYQN